MKSGFQSRRLCSTIEPWPEIADTDAAQRPVPVAPVPLPEVPLPVPDVLLPVPEPVPPVPVPPLSEPDPLFNPVVVPGVVVSREVVPLSAPIESDTGGGSVPGPVFMFPEPVLFPVPTVSPIPAVLLFASALSDFLPHAEIPIARAPVRSSVLMNIDPPCLYRVDDSEPSMSIAATVIVPVRPRYRVWRRHNRYAFRRRRYVETLSVRHAIRTINQSVVLIDGVCGGGERPVRSHLHETFPD